MAVGIPKELSLVCACEEPCACDTLEHQAHNANISHSKISIHMQQLLTRTIHASHSTGLATIKCVPQALMRHAKPHHRNRNMQLRVS